MILIIELYEGKHYEGEHMRVRKTVDWPHIPNVGENVRLGDSRITAIVSRREFYASGEIVVEARVSELREEYDDILTKYMQAGFYE